MIKKIIISFIIIGIIGGGTWFLLSSAPGKSVEKLRKKIDVLLTSKDPAEWKNVTTSKERTGKDLNDLQIRIDIAREASEAILEIYPSSKYDLIKRGLIEEYAGRPAEALKWYDRIASLKNPPAGNELRRARLLEKMGSYQAAKGAVSGVVDLFPFESNFELGRLHLETFQPLEAYRSFSRAKEYINNDDEQLRVLEGTANSLDFLISSTRNQLEKLKRDETDGPRITNLTNMLDRLTTERDKNLDHAIELLNKAEPSSRNQFVGIQIKIFELINKKDDPDKLKIARQTLIDAVSADEDLRYFPIYLLLGSVDLQLAYGGADKGSTDPIERTQYLDDSINNFRKVFAFDFEGTTAKVADIAEWNLSQHLSKDEFETRILLRICQSLIRFPEYWRICSSENPDGQRDTLEIRKRIERALKLNEHNKSVVEELRRTQALAALKNSDDDAYNAIIAELFSASSEGDRQQIALKLAQGISSFVPDQTEQLLELLDKEILGTAQQLATDEAQTFVFLKTAIRILNQERYKKYVAISTLQKDETKYNQTVDQIDSLTEKIQSSILTISKMSTTPAHFLLASKLMASLVGTQEALRVLQKGSEQFPEDFQLRYARGTLSLDMARKDRGDDRWNHLRNSLKEFLHVYKVRPYETEVASRLLSIGAQFGNNTNSPSMNLERIIPELFPNCSSTDAEVLSIALTGFLQRNYQRVVSKLPGLDQATTVRPFLNLIAGICYLEQANLVVKERLAQNPLISGQQESNTENQGQFRKLYQSARKEFEAGLTMDETYIPLQLELLKMDLNSVKAGEKIAEELIQKITNYANQHPDIPQIHFLLGTALKKKMESLITTNTKLSEISKVLSLERNSLRRAIKLNPLYSDAYIALAETYLIPWRLAKGPLSEHKNVYNKLGTPEFDVAISILQSAPATPPVLSLLGQYYEAEKNSEKALVYYKGLLQLEPITTNVSKVVQSYINIGDFKGARDWLNGIDGSKIRGTDFDVTRDTLMAYISSVEANAPALSEHKRNLLEENQIDQYRSIIENSEKLGKEPPILVVNNLAYLLANRGRGEEALELIEPLVKKLRSSKDNLIARPFEDIEDTYAWSLYKTGKHEEAIAVYDSLCSKETRLDIHLNYAKFLFDLKKYHEALKQIQIILNSDSAEKRNVEEETRELQDQIELALKP